MIKAHMLKQAVYSSNLFSISQRFTSAASLLCIPGGGLTALLVDSSACRPYSGTSAVKKKTLPNNY